MVRQSLKTRDCYLSMDLPPEDGESDVGMPSSPKECNTLFSQPHLFQLDGVTFPVVTGGGIRTVHKHSGLDLESGQPVESIPAQR